MTRVLIYNAGGAEVVGSVSLEHAIGMLCRNVARAKEWVEGENFGPFQKVTAVELVNYVYAKWKYATTGRIPFSRTGVLIRDKYHCTYCNKSATTLDHVLPRCQGGKTTWDNCVAACSKCNSKKGGRTPEQAGMKLLHQPVVPTTLAQIHPLRR